MSLFFRAPFLFIVSCYTLIISPMLSLLMESILTMLLPTLSVSGLICINSLNWLLNFNLMSKTLRIEVGEGLLNLKLGKIESFHVIVQKVWCY